jgi:hypothetical protein
MHLRLLFKRREGYENHMKIDSPACRLSAGCRQRRVFAKDHPFTEQCFFKDPF